MTVSGKASLGELRGWLNAIRTLEGMLRIRLAGKTCHLAIDYWVIHQYAFPSHRDILSDQEHIKERLYQNSIRCDWILNWLPMEWKEPLILPPPYKMELAFQLDRLIGPEDFWVLDEAAVRSAIQEFIREFDQNTEKLNLQEQIDAGTLGKLYETWKILFLAVALGTREGFKKVRDLIRPPDASEPNLAIEPVSETQKAMWKDVQEHQAEIERNASSFWEPILGQQPRREAKHASNSRDSLALEWVRFINSRWNRKGMALILISGAPSLLGTLAVVPTDQGEVAVSVSGEAQETLHFPFVVSPDFFSFYLSHAARKTALCLRMTPSYSSWRIPGKGLRPYSISW
ncbi:MAG: hypothetical protein FJY85_04920 [Deltaproteobacteria bacterium]|nr:hypothetical protein [Deltaproteobacteria bacterium]